MADDDRDDAQRPQGDEGYEDNAPGVSGYEFGDEDQDGVFGVDGGMNPDHPLLARAQAALKQQLLDAKQRLEEELREKSESLKRAKQKREDIGVELFGTQQQLASLQLGLEKAQDLFEKLRVIRAETESELERVKGAAAQQETSVKQEEVQVSAFQSELDKLGNMLKQIERHNDQMKNEIAVTRRATYAAEEAAQKIEKDKRVQDGLIDKLQDTLKQHNQQIALFKAQIMAQREETQQAMATLAEATREMEAIYFEKKQLAQQWKSTLTAIAKRDEALQAVEEAIRHQGEEELALTTELEGIRREIKQEQSKNEQLTSVLKKVEGERDFLAKTIQQLLDKQDKIKDQYLKLSKSLEQTEDLLQKSTAEGRQLEAKVKALDQQYVKTANDLQDLSGQMLARLSEQMTAEKAAQKTLQETRDLRKKVRDQELNAVTLENELAKVEVDTLNTDAHIKGLDQTLKLLDKEIEEKMSSIEKYEVELRRRNDEIEKKTKQVDLLNKQYERLTANQTEENMGPLEATIHNLSREIARKGLEGKELQRRWVGFQSELVAILQDNNVGEERIQRKKAEITVLQRKKMRLEQQYEHHIRGIKEMDMQMSRLQAEMSRLNTLIAKNAELQKVLESDNFNLESKIMLELRELESQAAHLEGSIETTNSEKQDLLATLVETERQVMLWERKLQLEKEMQEAIDPEAGNDVVEAMRKEVHRMRVRYNELMKLQEKLIGELERGVAKRDIISTKGKSMQTREKSRGGDATEAGHIKQVAQIKQSIRDTEKETASTEERLKDLENVRAKIAEDSEKVGARCYALRTELEDVRAGLDKAANEKQKMLMKTAKVQRMVKKYEEFLAGKTAMPADSEAGKLQEELNRAADKKERLVQALTVLKGLTPKLSTTFDRLLLQLG